MRALLLFALVLSGCASIPKPGPVREAQPVLLRGWNFIEPDAEFLAVETGASPISYSGPVIADEKLVFGSERFGLVALLRRSGKVLWRRMLDSALIATPLVSEGKVYAGTESGALYSLDLDGGGQLWRSELGAPVQGTFLLAFQRLYVGTADEAIHAVDPSTGKVLWSYRRPAFAGTSVRGGGNPAAVDGKVWIGFSDGTLVALNPDSGALEVERQYRDNLKFSDIDARVVGWRDGMLVSTYDGRLRFLRKDGSLIWEFASGGARAPVLGDGEILYYPSSDGAVYALTGNTGKEIWSFPLRRGVPTSVVLVTHKGRKLLLVTASEEKVFVLDAANGQLLGQSSFGRRSGSFGTIAADAERGTFYVVSHSSRVHEFLLRL